MMAAIAVDDGKKIFNGHIRPPLALPPQRLLDWLLAFRQHFLRPMSDRNSAIAFPCRKTNARLSPLYQPHIPGSAF
jgi:hypothetical protein